MTIEVVRGLEVGSTRNRIAVANYADTGRVDFFLNRYPTSLDNAKAIALLRRVNGGNNIQSGFDALQENVFNQRNGDRDDETYPNVAVVFVSGSPSDQRTIAEKASALQVQRGATIVAVDVEGRASQQVLDAIASGDSRGKFVLRGDYWNLGAILDRVISKACTPPTRSKFMLNPILLSHSMQS